MRHFYEDTQKFTIKVITYNFHVPFHVCYRSNLHWIFTGKTKRLLFFFSNSRRLTTKIFQTKILLSALAASEK